MQETILDQICSQIYTEIDAILLKHPKGVKVKESTLQAIKLEVEAYLLKALETRLINVLPTVKVEFDKKDIMLRLYDPQTGRQFDAIDEIVKMPVNWNVGSKESH